MKYRLYRVVVQGVDQGQVLDDDAPKLLDVHVEVAAEQQRYDSRKNESIATEFEPIPLQQQVRTALEAARPGGS